MALAMQNNFTLLLIMILMEGVNLLKGSGLKLNYQVYGCKM